MQSSLKQLLSVSYIDQRPRARSPYSSPLAPFEATPQKQIDYTTRVKHAVTEVQRHLVRSFIFNVLRDELTVRHCNVPYSTYLFLIVSTICDGLSWRHVRLCLTQTTFLARVFTYGSGERVPVCPLDEHRRQNPCPN